MGSDYNRRVQKIASPAIPNFAAMPAPGAAGGLLRAAPRPFSALRGRDGTGRAPGQYLPPAPQLASCPEPAQRSCLAAAAAGRGDLERPSARTASPAAAGSSTSPGRSVTVYARLPGPPRERAAPRERIPRRPASPGGRSSLRQAPRRPPPAGWSSAAERRPSLPAAVKRKGEEARGKRAERRLTPGLWGSPLTGGSPATSHV